MAENIYNFQPLVDNKTIWLHNLDVILMFSIKEHTGMFCFLYHIIILMQWISYMKIYQLLLWCQIDLTITVKFLSGNPKDEFQENKLHLAVESSEKLLSSCTLVR